MEVNGYQIGSGADLAGADLTDADLSSVDLSDAWLACQQSDYTKPIIITVASSTLDRISDGSDVSEYQIIDSCTDRISHIVISSLCIS